MKRVAIFLTKNECDAIAGKPNATGRELERAIMKVIERHINEKKSVEIGGDDEKRNE